MLLLLIIITYDLFENLQENPTSDFMSFETKFNSILDKHAPIKQKVFRGNDKPYVNKSLRKAISTRSRLRRIANETGNPEDIAKYKRQRNFVTFLNGKTKKNYYKSLDLSDTSMCKKFWKIFKPYFSAKNYSPEKMIIIENKEVLSDDLTIAECLNDYFVNITKTIEIQNWPEPTMIIENIIDRAIYKYKDHPSIQMINSKISDTGKKFAFQHIFPENVYDQVKKLDPSKSSSGNIPTKIVKDSINISCNHITDCLNASINNCLFPSIMKLGDVTPAYKKGEKELKENYRPLCTLSPFSKVFERILFNQITSFMNNKLSDNLCGFRKGYSTQHALIQLIENWRNHLEKKEIIGVILCDLSKAFDTLPHDLLIAKLDAYGFGNEALKLIYDYLNGRKQRCKVGSAYSSWLDVISGVPQGSVLGPLLFNIFLNDFFFFLNESNVCNFADDNSIYASGKSQEEVFSKLEKEMKTAMTWFLKNSMAANPKKFQFMILGTKTLTKKCLNINGRKCISTNLVTLLGIKIDWKLNFNKHVNFLCEKASSRAKALHRLRTVLSLKQKVVLYNSFIMSNFNYCPVIWMHCGKTSNEKVNKIQKRALQAIYGDFNSSFTELLDKGKHLNIHELNKRSLLIEIYKCLNKINPPFLNDIIKRKETSINLRIKNLLILPQALTKSWGLHSFVYRGSRLWNSFPDDIKDSETLNSFKSKLRKHEKIFCSCKLCLEQ